MQDEMDRLADLRSICDNEDVALLAWAVKSTEEADVDNLFCEHPGCNAQAWMDRDGLDMCVGLAKNAYDEGWRSGEDGWPRCPRHANRNDEDVAASG